MLVAGCEHDATLPVGAGDSSVVDAGEPAPDLSPLPRWRPVASGTSVDLRAIAVYSFEGNRQAFVAGDGGTSRDLFAVRAGLIVGAAGTIVVGAP